MYDVRFLSQAEKYYRKAPVNILKRLHQCFEHLQKSPVRNAGKIKRLKGHNDLYRYRIGDF